MKQYSGLRRKNWMAAMLAVALLMVGCVGGAMAESLDLTSSQMYTIWSNYSGAFDSGLVRVTGLMTQGATLELVDANGAKTGETLALAAGDQVSVYDYSEPTAYVYATTASGAVLAGCVKATAVLPKALVNKPEDLGLYLNMENMDTDMSGID